MLIIGFILWVLIWGVVGYFTVRIIKACLAIREAERTMTAYYQQRRLMQMARTGKYNIVNINIDPFEDLS